MNKCKNFSVATAVLIAALMVLSAMPTGNMLGTATASNTATAPRTATSPSMVDLGIAGSFTILAQSLITTTGTTSIVGDIGISPAAATFIQGFGLSYTPGDDYSTSSLVDGKVYAPEYSGTTATMLGTAVSNKDAAYSEAIGRPVDETELGTGDITGLILNASVYSWAGGVVIGSAGVTINVNGTADDVWIFIIGGTLTVAADAEIYLTNGALPARIFWAVAGVTSIGANAKMKGIILCESTIGFITGASLTGRALSKTDVTLQSNAITPPTTSSPDDDDDDDDDDEKEKPASVPGYDAVLLLLVVGSASAAYGLIRRKRISQN